MRSSAKRLWSDQSGAIAAVYALALPALIVCGGIAFDYARLAAMDTELQNAADQAALAAATQLDGTATSCARAVGAARTLITNSTLFANDGNASGLTVAIADQTANNGCGDVGDKIKFYTVYTSASSNTVTTNPLAAKFVSVTVNSRKAVYALTPIVSLLNSGDLAGTAVAGLGSAICKVPPVMICNPDEPVDNGDVNFPFDAASRIGFGMKLIGDGSYAPGTFGYLETNFGNGANDLLAAIGHNSPPGECSAIGGVKVKAGFNANVIDGFNTRFDINANGNSCPNGDVNCSPSINVRKDLVRGNQCGITGNGWQEVAANSGNYTTKRYRPTSAAFLPAGTTLALMGFPRDLCHAWSDSATCSGGSGRIGNGQWDRDVYFKSNYNLTPAQWTMTTGLPSNATRYQVYKWEYENPAVAGSINTVQSDGPRAAYSTPQTGQCLAPGITPNPASNSVDRRRISAAVLNCEAHGVGGGGNTVYPVTKWIDLFLVEPSYDRKRCDPGGGGGGGSICNDPYTTKTDVYVEIIGETLTGGDGSTAGQVTRRDVPYLIE
jgi:Flp pilus assembly protein TadG